MIGVTTRTGGSGPGPVGEQADDDRTVGGRAEVGMSLLAWVAVLVGAWCLASVLAAVGFGVYARRARQRGGPTRRPSAPDTLDPLDTGPLRMWLAELPETPEPAGR